MLIEEPVRDFHGAALKGCDECADFLGHAADISIGSVGSADGYSSVLVRSEAGLVAFDTRPRPAGAARPRPPRGAAQARRAGQADRLAQPQAGLRPDAPLFIDYAEHV